MALGYTRTNASDIQPGLTVKAGPLNNELNAIQLSFDASLGHNHDGTAGGGAPLTRLSLAGFGAVTGLVAVDSGSTFASRAIAGTANQITVTNGSGVSGNPTISLPANIVVGTSTFVAAGAAAQFTNSIAGSYQFEIQNLNSGMTASGDYVATANSGSDTSQYVNMGINNSAFSDATWTINGALDSYLYASDGILSVGTASNKKFSIFTGGTLAANERITVLGTGNVGINKLAPTTALDVGGTVTATSFVGPLTGNATNVTGIVALANGGTGNSTAAGARGALNLGTSDTPQFANLTVSNTAGTNRRYQLMTSGVARWDMTAKNDAESGADAGTTWQLNAYNDSGTYIDSPIQVARVAGGTMTVSRPLNLTNALSVASGGTGGNTATNARTNLGLGTMATQSASAVAITGGTASGLNISGSAITSSGITGSNIDNSPIGSTTRNAGAFTTMAVGTGTVNGALNVVGLSYLNGLRIDGTNASDTIYSDGTRDLGISAAGAYNMKFNTGNAERGRITSTGYLLMGATSTAFQFDSTASIYNSHVLQAGADSNVLTLHVNGNGVNLHFSGYNSINERISAARWTGGMTTVTDGNEDGYLTSTLLRSGTPYEVMRLQRDAVIFQNTQGNESVYIDTTAAGQSAIYLRQAGTLRGLITHDGTNFNLLAQTGTAYFGCVSAAETRLVQSNTTRCLINGSGDVAFPKVYSLTTAAAANVFIDVNGYLYRSTSSLRFKTGVEKVQSSYAARIMDVDPIWYRSLSPNDNPEHSHWGFAAEELAKVDPRLVHFGYAPEDYEEVADSEGLINLQVKKGAKEVPMGVQYERIPVLHHVLIKELLARVKKLEGKKWL